uniref:Uncharacterized protein n=1 Tax=Anguilla anguilla TaxID=7936 RepID=A0A0E9Y0K8_ANGAN
MIYVHYMTSWPFLQVKRALGMNIISSINCWPCDNPVLNSYASYSCQRLWHILEVNSHIVNFLHDLSRCI